MRNPNGLGSCYKLSGKRRKPYIARVTTGWSNDGKQIYKTIGYFETKKDGLIALANYHSNPSNISEDMTFSQIYDLWSSRKYELIGNSAIRNYKNAYNLSSELHNMKIKDIKYIHLQTIIDNCEREVPTLKKIKGLWGQIYEYSLQNDLISKDYSSLVKLPKYEKKAEKKPFSNEEINILWNNKDDDTIKLVLIMIYTGFRIGELLEMETKNIDIDNMILVGGNKTEAGKNRVVPVNHKIQELVKYFYNPKNKYLLGKTKLSYWTYRSRFETVMNDLKMNHNMHECRHTFATLMNNSDANGTSIKKLIGHTDFEFTEKVYTHKDIEELRKAIELI